MDLKYSAKQKRIITILKYYSEFEVVCLASYVLLVPDSVLAFEDLNRMFSFQNRNNNL